MVKRIKAPGVPLWITIFALFTAVFLRSAPTYIAAFVGGLARELGDLLHPTPAASPHSSWPSWS